MNQLLANFDEEAQRPVIEAVTRAEQKTAAEIIPVVTRCSGSYDRGADIVGLWSGMILLGAVWLAFQGVSEDVGWAGVSQVRLGFWIVVAVFLVGFIGGVVLAHRYAWLQRLFVPRQEMERALASRAKAVFFDRRLHRTSRGSSVLLLVSLLERMVLVVADDTVAENLNEESLKDVRNQVIAGIREKGLAEGFVRGVDRLGETLAESFPAGEGHSSEIPDEVVVLDD